MNQLKKSYSVGDLHGDQPTRRGSAGNRRAIMQDESDAPASSAVRVHHQTHLASLPDVSDSEVDDFNDPISGEGPFNVEQRIACRVILSTGR